MFFIMITFRIFSFINSLQALPNDINAKTPIMLALALLAIVINAFKVLPVLSKSSTISTLSPLFSKERGTYNDESTGGLKVK